MCIILGGLHAQNFSFFFSHCFTLKPFLSIYLNYKAYTYFNVTLHSLVYSALLHRRNTTTTTILTAE